MCKSTPQTRSRRCLNCQICVCMQQVCSQFVFAPYFPLSPNSAMAPVGIVLTWALSGCEIQRWQKVPLDSFLEDVVTEDMLDAFPGQVEVLIGQRRLQRPLHIEARHCIGSGDDVLLLGLVRTQAFKDEDCDLVPYPAVALINSLCLSCARHVRACEYVHRINFEPD